MKILLNKAKIYVIILMLLAFCGNVKAQCSITGISPNASTYNPNPCTLLSGCGAVLYIGDGINPTNLIMSTALNLTCLGSIQLIVRNNASIDFSSGNDYLTLAAGSSISFEGTGTLIGGSCNSSERIYIGADLIASCNGNGPGADYSFPGLVTVGGYNIVNISPTSASVCGSGSFSFTATAIPSATATAIRWYSAASGGTLLQTTSGSSSTYTTPTISTTTTYYAEATIGAFITPRKAVVATVNVLPTTPIVATTQPTCTVPTGTITVTAPTGMNYSIDGLTYTNTSGIFSSVSPGTYSVTAKNSSGCISNATAVTIKNATNTWNGSAWSNGSTPVITENIVFNAFYLSTSDLSGCSCQANADVTINSGTLTLTNGLTVASGVNMVFESGASLVQTNNVSNTGDIEYNRITQSRNSDYTYWSSPVSSLQPLGGVTGLFPDSLNGTFYSFDSSINPSDWKNESDGTPMTVGKGYIARGPEDLGNQTPPNTPFTTTFYGVPNNGTINVPIIHSGAVDGTSNLIGNPYPSAIDADTFLSTNSSVIEGTIYFWTHNTAIGTGTTELGLGLYPYTGADYASYNGTGGAAGSGGKIPNGKIAAGQGFFVTSKLASGNAKFENTMRLSGTTLPDESGVNQQFFKKRNPKSEKIIEKHRIWLNLINTQGAFKQTLIGYVTDATNDYDSRFDGESFDGNEFVDFYSVNQDKNLVIQGRALPFDENDEVSLGYRTTINGDFTINIDQTDGLLTNQAVFIEDKLVNTVFDLKSGAYTFNTVAGTFNDRFVLRYANKTLATKNFNSLENKVLVSTKNKQIKINSFAETIDKVTVYDLLGRQVYHKVNVNNNELSIANLVSGHQTLVIKTTLQNGEIITDKIIY